MRRRAWLIATALALFFSASGSFAAKPSSKPKAVPAASPGRISDALCGRGSGSRARLAKGLDDPAPLPSVWREEEVKSLLLWRDAPICPEASELEINLRRSRQLRLDQLGDRLERAQMTEKLGPRLEQFRGWRPVGEWPRSPQCGGCAALWSAAARVTEIASRWPARTGSKLGAWLEAEEKRKPLVVELCEAKPPPGARAEIEKRFRYYSWTADGAKLFAVAALFEQSEIVAGCGGR